MWRIDSVAAAATSAADRAAGALGAPAPQGQARSSQPYKEVRESICLHNHWLVHTQMLRYLETFGEIFRQRAALLQLCEGGEVTAIFEQCLKHGNQASAHDTIKQFYTSREQNRRHVGLAMLLLLKYETSDGIFALVERLKEYMGRCESARRQAYCCIVRHGAHLLEFPSAPGRATQWDDLLHDLQHSHRATACACPAEASVKQQGDSALAADALRRIHDCIEDYLDTHKENAFKSAFQEPARLYFDLCGNTHHRDHVNVHGLNGFLCIIRGGLGIRLPLVPFEEDHETFKGCTNMWNGLTIDAWEHFSRKENFGKNFESIKAFQTGRNRFLHTKQYGGEGAGRPFIGRNAGALELRALRGDPKLLEYVRRYAHFFTPGFLVQRMFEVLNSEIKPEHVGFSKACDTLFALYRAERGVAEEALLEHLYDEYMTTLDVERAAAFLQWLGVLR